MAGYIGSKGSGIISGIDASIAELNLNDKASANGTTEANKVLTADGNKDVTAIRNLTATGDATVGGSVTATGTVTRALTRGSIDVGNSSGVSSALAKGAAGTVLTSDGTDLSFVAASGGGTEFIASSGAISNAATVAFTQFNASKYDSYLFTFLNVVSASDEASLLLQTSTDGGSNYDSGSSDYVVGYAGAQNNLFEAGFDLTSANINISTYQGTASGEGGGCSGHMFIYGPHLTQPTRILGQTTFFKSNGYWANLTISGQRTSSADVDAVKFYFNSGNIASGEITMFGIVNS